MRRRPRCGKGVQRGLLRLADLGDHFLNYAGMLSPICAETRKGKKEFMNAVAYARNLALFLEERRETRKEEASHDGQ